MIVLCVCLYSVIISNNGSVLGKTRKNHIPRVGDFNEVRVLILISLLANNPCLQALMSFPRAEKNFCYLPLVAFIELMQVGPSKFLKHIM